MAACRRVYDSRYLQADCQEPGSAPEPYTLGSRVWASFTFLLLKLIHTATPDMTKLSCLCLVRFAGANWILDTSRLSPTETL